MTSDSYLDCLIIGAGPVGISLGLRLYADGVRDIELIEKGREVDTWDSNFAGTSPTRTGIYFSDTICPGDSPVPPLADYARQHPDMTGQYYESDHLPKEVLQDYYRDAARAAGVPVRTRTTVTALWQRGPDYVVRLSTGEEIRSRTVVDATGIVWSQNWPDLARELPPDRCFHSIGHGILQESAPGQRILVIGGGHATPDIAVRMAERGARVTISTWQRRFRIQLLPYPYEYLSERFQGKYQKSSLAGRYHLLTSMWKLGPWVTPRSYHEMLSFIRKQRDGGAGQIEIAQANTVTAIRERHGELIASLSCGWQRSFDSVVCATGFTAHVPDRLAYSWPDGFWLGRTHAGFPVIDDDYQLAGAPGLYFLGYLGQLGPRGPVDAIMYNSQPTVRGVARAIQEFLRQRVVTSGAGLAAEGTRIRTEREVQR